VEKPVERKYVVVFEVGTDLDLTLELLLDAGFNEL
jgi:hypothetical protein